MLFFLEDVFISQFYACFIYANFICSYSISQLKVFNIECVIIYKWQQLFSGLLFVYALWITCLGLMSFDMWMLWESYQSYCSYGSGLMFFFVVISIITRQQWNFLLHISLGLFQHLIIMQINIILKEPVTVCI